MQCRLIPFRTCYAEALRREADIVVMMHPDFQYDPKSIPLMVEPRLARQGCEGVRRVMALCVGAKHPSEQQAGNTQANEREFRWSRSPKGE